MRERSNSERFRDTIGRFVALPNRACLALGFQEIGYAMPSTAILYEIQTLYDVSDRLDSLSEQHPLVAEALITISGSVRNTATLLEVLVATKMQRLYGLQRADA